MTGNFTLFNSSNEISWNNSLIFSATQADGRKVATHETGHMEGLGHTAHDPAVMRQGGVSYYALQTDDISVTRRKPLWFEPRRIGGFSRG
ncbi:matrixin family metalloprotease, partial [Dictyobacter vulcani]|uniref:matrixin family metalloprotease n=1 Tax=Dictyobacter vulcani TaxID=2607529 RepID=UPI00353095F9